MEQLRSEVIADYDWRLGELAIIKTLPFRYGMKENDKYIYLKYSIPAIYSLWEGFVINSFSIVVREINKKEYPLNKINKKLICYAMDNKRELVLKVARTEIKNRENYIENIMFFMESKFHLNPSIETRSNVNFKVIDYLLERFNFCSISKDLHHQKLNKLVLFRNAIAHGDNSLPVDKEVFEELCRTFVDVMTDTASTIIDGFEKKLFLI